MPSAGALVTRGFAENQLGISHQTFNFYIQALKQFCRWMVLDGRAQQSPVVHLTGLNVHTDRRHDRRALGDEELKRLLAHVAAAADSYGMSGAERAMLYRLAVETGLRAGELRSLTRSSFYLEADPPLVVVAAAYSKHRREDKLPLRPELAQALHTFLAQKAPAASAFHMPRRELICRMMRADIEGAGLLYKDAAKLVADFHCLRHTFISNLARAGVHPKVAQTLARHSTITLTMDRYSHSQMDELKDALKKLPSIAPPPPDAGDGTAAAG